MIRDVLKEIVLSSFVKFIIGNKEIPSGVLYSLKSEHDKVIMLARYVNKGSYTYKIHTYDKGFNELDCKEFNNLKDFQDLIHIDDMVFNAQMNDLVLNKLKQKVANLTRATHTDF